MSSNGPEKWKRHGFLLNIFSGKQIFSPHKTKKPVVIICHGLAKYFLLWQPGYPGDLQLQIQPSSPLVFYLKARNQFLVSFWTRGFPPSDYSKFGFIGKYV
jgi:hypothetical protein